MSTSPGSPTGNKGLTGLLGKIFSSNSRSKPSGQGLASGEGVFGVALHESLKYASVAISQVGPDGRARVYGHIPVVVAKAGLFLKEQGITTPGIFRVSGSNKRIKDLEQIFDTPPTYGKDMIWDSFSVHDAASAFRRYLNMLPMPIIPFELYGAFQDALPRAPSPPTESQMERAVERYRVLMKSLPPSSQHIFFYTLDLLSVFHRNSEQNLMPASNLATIFQPGLLRHPHDVPSRPSAPADGLIDADAVKAQVEADANEHRRSQEVLVFLIEHQDAFELELPKRIRKTASTTSGLISTASQAASGRHSTIPPSTDQETWNVVSAGPAGATQMMDRSNRLRRKVRRPESARTAPIVQDKGTAASQSREPPSALLAEFRGNVDSRIPGAPPASTGDRRNPLPPNGSMGVS